MTVHKTSDAQLGSLVAEMTAIGAAAREAARAMREAGNETKTKALTVAAAAIRRRAADILAANAPTSKPQRPPTCPHRWWSG